MASRHDAVSFRGGLQPRSTDVFIAVMGVTGAGKSSFIAQCCNTNVPIGHNLQACTSIVTVYPCTLSTATTLYLVDTPGFDDTNRSDTEVLRELATWLTDSYTAHIKLSGIIYLHRISDVRMQGSAKKNLFMFKKLCGNDALKNVILATTMWDRVSEAEGDARELELTSTMDFWGWMVSQGSRVLRHTGTRDSAMDLVQLLIQDKTSITLDLQQQMVNEKKDLEDTNAGKEVRAEIIRERERTQRMIAEIQEQHSEALRAQDMRSAQALAEVKQDYNDQIAQLDRSFARVKISTQKLIEEKYERMLKEQEKRHAEMLHRMEAESKRKELESTKVDDKLIPPTYAGKGLAELLFKGSKLSDPTSGPVPATKPLDYSLSVHGYSWYFKGPKSSDGQWHNKATNKLDSLASRNYRLLALGEESSFVCVRDGSDGGIGSDRIEWSDNLDKYYPNLLKVLKANKCGKILMVSLGSNGHFFVKGRDWIEWWLSSEILDRVDMDSNYKKVDLCALGISGSYIISFSGGTQYWDLAKRYADLKTKIEEYVLKDGKRFKAATLSLSSDESYYVLFSTNDGNRWNTWRLSKEDHLKSRWTAWEETNIGHNEQ